MGQCITKRKDPRRSSTHFDLLEVSTHNEFLNIVPHRGKEMKEDGKEDGKENGLSTSLQTPTTSLMEEMSKRDVESILVKGALPKYRQKASEDKPVDMIEDSLSLQKSGIAHICRKGLKSEEFNQDDFCISLSRGKLFLGVFDGHGPEGHHVSSLVREKLPGLLLTDCEQSQFVVQVKEAFEKVHSEVAGMKGGALAEYSGSTTSVVVVSGSSLYSAHVGDSRVVLGKRVNGSLQAEPLTNDHKPSTLKEKQRIERSGGIVRRYNGDISYRVFESGSNTPGLSLSRAVGDLAAHRLGVTHLPEVSCLSLSKEYEFVLLCSDGVWEFISSEQAVAIISGFSRTQAHEAATALANLAWNRWIEEEKNSADDITVLLAYLPVRWSESR